MFGKSRLLIKLAPVTEMVNDVSHTHIFKFALGLACTAAVDADSAVASFESRDPIQVFALRLGILENRTFALATSLDASHQHICASRFLTMKTTTAAGERLRAEEDLCRCEETEVHRNASKI